jgi:Spy/CpxP family protein refolding chaperone
VDSKAQDNDDNINVSKIQAQRVAFFTERLNLTPAEAEKFWPIYNEYDAKRAKLNAEESRLINLFKENKSSMTDKEIDNDIKKIFETRKAITALNEEYYQKFRQVLPARKVMKLIITETQFRVWLLNKLRPSR